MKTAQFFRPGRTIALLAIGVALLITAYGVSANTRTDGGGDLPYYARIERNEVLQDGEWAAIVFYRPPACVPDSFNLLNFYDFAAFDCTPPTTDGFIIWSGEPWESDPIQIRLYENPVVPVWFVEWVELKEAIRGGLTMPELEALPSLRTGSATTYSETLHPSGAVKVPMINIVAEGNMDDNGQLFYVHALLVVDTVANVQITFR
jgi:hypothetical protein